MWGVEHLWPESILLLAALGSRWRLLPPVFLTLYGAAFFILRESQTYLFHFSTYACWIMLLFSAITATAWIIAPVRGAAVVALLLQFGSYSFLLRSANLAFTWVSLESAALAGYFFIAHQAEASQRWRVAIRYFGWSVLGSAFILLGIALRLSGGMALHYPLSSESYLSDTLLALGWAIKAGFIPWHFWLMGIYRSLPAAWGAWFSVVPKGALLLNFITGASALRLDLFYGLAGVSLLGSYALAWRAERLPEMVFWGSFGQGAFVALSALPGQETAVWEFWAMYGVVGFVGLLYAEMPWQTPMGKAVGLLLLANLAGLPPVWGFWVKVQLLWAGVNSLSTLGRVFLMGSAAVAMVGGFAVYGKLLWRIWNEPASLPPSLLRRALYFFPAVVFLGIGVGGG